MDEKDLYEILDQQGRLVGEIMATPGRAGLLEAYAWRNKLAERRGADRHGYFVTLVRKGDAA